MQVTDNKYLVSVVMPVFNAEAYLEEAVQSVLDQTYENFELLLINDGSTDNSRALAENLGNRDKRIKYFDNGENKGVAFTRNVGLKNAKGTFLCWMDSDDTCNPKRIEKQVAFLLQNPEIGAIGTQIERFNSQGVFEQTALEANPEYIKASLLFRPAAVPNATVMLRTELIKRFGLFYDNHLKIGEDYDFVAHCSHHFPISILPEVLYSYRVAENSITESFSKEATKTFENIKKVLEYQLRKVGLEPTEKDLLIHDSICNSEMITSLGTYKDGIGLMLKIEEANKISNIFDEEQLKKVLKIQYVFFGKKAGPIGIKALVYHTKMGFKLGYNNGIKDWLKVAIRGLLRYHGFEFDLRTALSFKT